MIKWVKDGMIKSLIGVKKAPIIPCFAEVATLGRHRLADGAMRRRCMRLILLGHQ